MGQFMKLSKQKDVEIKDEVDKYFNVLDWWKEFQFFGLEEEKYIKENTLRCPILAKISKDIVAVLASTVASAFSFGIRVVNPFRATLTPKMIEGLICLNDWLRGESFFMYNEPTKTELELYTKLE
ncbi:hypothetical protein QQ045_012234 [Rhodiola kirilowii]